MKTPGYLIRIPEPCHEDWSAMQPDANGKFCSSCSKSVVDFSNKSDTQIRDLLLQHKDQKVCGHFKRSQVERPLNISVDLHHLPRNINVTRAFAIAVLLAFGTILFSCTTREGEKVGRIELVNNTQDYIMGAMNIPDPPDEDTMTVPTPPEALMMGEISVVDTTVTTPQSSCSGDPFITGDVAMIPEPTDTVPVIDEPIIMGLIALPLQVDTATTISDSLFISATDKVSKQPVAINNDKLSIYPNPTGGEFSVKYTLRKPADVRIDIFDLSGTWLKTVVNVNGQHSGSYEVPVDLQNAATGLYLVNMISSGERFTAKLIVER